MGKTGRRRDARGFTLVEILVAFAILALSVAALMQAFSGGLRMLSVSNAHAEALRIAENRLAETGRAFPLAAGTETGAEGRYHWLVETTPYADEGGGAEFVPPAYDVTVTVRWAGGNSLRLSTIELGPPANE